MIFLSIVERELCVRARRGATDWTRLGVALVGALVCLIQLGLGNAASGVSAAGSAVFQALVGAAFLLCFGSCWSTADGIRAERRDGSLGLLLLTYLEGFDPLRRDVVAALRHARHGTPS